MEIKYDPVCDFKAKHTHKHKEKICLKQNYIVIQKA